MFEKRSRLGPVEDILRDKKPTELKLLFCSIWLAALILVCDEWKGYVVVISNIFGVDRE